MSDQQNQKKKAKPSVKHHYLPQNYLKGFTDSDGGFWVYDKKKGNIFRTSPVGVFFEKNLNTVTFPNDITSDFLEDFYTELENKSWESLDNIRTSTSKTLIQLSDKMSLFFFLLFLHWRLPTNIEFAEQLSEKAFNEESNVLDFFSLFNKDGEKAPKEMGEMIRSSSAFKKSTKVLAPFAPFFKDKSWSKNLENWRFLYSGDDKNWHIVGDNPIITEGLNDHDPINCLKEFVFPVSGRILLVNTTTPINKGFPPEIVIQYGTAIIHRAQRFVACQNKSFLEALVKRYNLYGQFKKTDLIIPELFQTFKQT